VKVVRQAADVRRCHLGEGSGPRPNVVVPGQTDCLITLTWAGGECWGCRQGGVAEAQNADPVRRFPSLQVRPCKLDFDAALEEALRREREARPAAEARADAAGTS
jgi:hypothetical protein